MSELSRQCLALLTLIAIGTGCDASTDSRGSTPPSMDLIQGVLHHPLAEALDTIRQTYPEAISIPSPFTRVKLGDGGTFEELVLFEDLHSGQVDAIIFKSRPSMTPRQRGALAEQLQIPWSEDLAHSSTASEVRRDLLVWRLRGRDRHGRLSLTVEVPKTIP